MNKKGMQNASLFLLVIFYRWKKKAYGTISIYRKQKELTSNLLIKKFLIYLSIHNRLTQKNDSKS